MSGRKIYLDDERELPDWMDREDGWIVVRTPHEFLAAIKDGLSGIDAISFDNDLGVGYAEGWELLNEVERMVREDGEPCPKLYAHTANPAAAKRMYACILSLQQFDRERVA